MNNENNLHLIKICEKLDKLQQSVNQLQKDVEILKNNNKSISYNCEKMNNHINFIENIYENVKSPLEYLCNKIYYLMGSNNTSTISSIKKS